MMTPSPKTPWWMLVVIIVAALPVLQLPFLLSGSGEDTPTPMLWLYPLYVVVAAYLAYQCYGERRAMAWILIALMLLSHAAMWMLVNTPIS